MGNETSKQDQVPQDQDQVEDDSFFSSLEDIVCFLEGVGPTCDNLQDMIDMVKLALKNRSQRELLRSHLTPKRMRR